MTEFFFHYQNESLKSLDTFLGPWKADEIIGIDNISGKINIVKGSSGRVKGQRTTVKLARTQNTENSGNRIQ